MRLTAAAEITAPMSTINTSEIVQWRQQMKGMGMRNRGGMVVFPDSLLRSSPGHGASLTSTRCITNLGLSRLRHAFYAKLPFISGFPSASVGDVYLGADLTRGRSPKALHGS